MNTKIKVKITREENATFFKANIGDVVEIDYEEIYLRGVVGSEIGNPHIEAAKAQAICARTYSLKAFLNNVPISDSSSVAQAFRAPRAVSSAYANAHAGVDATKGVVVCYKGTPISSCVYTDSNGGRTVSSKERWGSDRPYLIAQDDPWDAVTSGGIKRGHGCGMSQHGIKYAASIGVKYPEMLAFYYPGTEIISNYGEQKKEGETQLLDPQKVVNIALAEVGYVEKNTTKYLDDKTADAGTKNYTKYSRDIAAWVPDYYNGGKQGAAWCDVFFDWCFLKAYGSPAGRLMIYQPLRSCGAGCKYSRQFYKNNKQLFDAPQIGDQIFFWPKDRSDPNAVQHTGLVYNFDAKKVYTVEGNASNKVQKKSYAFSDPTIAGYGRPNWNEKSSSTIPTTPTIPTAPVEDTTPTLKRNAQGNYVKILQTRLNVHGHPGRTKDLAVDGKFGPLTEACLKAFQSVKKLKSDGICDDATWAELLKAPPKPVEKYTVTITGLTEAQKNELLVKWTTAKAVKE
jgi:hypothetical protein